jgi:hypothetical protein
LTTVSGIRPVQGVNHLIEWLDDCFQVFRRWPLVCGIYRDIYDVMLSDLLVKGLGRVVSTWN